MDNENTRVNEPSVLGSEPAERGYMTNPGFAPRSDYRSGRTSTLGNNALVERIRENPVPAILAGASLAWLAFGGRRRYDDSAIYGTTVNGEPFIRQTRIDLNTSGDQSADRKWTGQAQQTVRHATDQAQHAVGRATAQLREGAQEARYRGRQFANQSPMAAGMLAAVAGLAIGMMLPETERENELLGDTRDALLERGRETVKETAQQVQQVASTVTDAAKTIVGGTESSASKETAATRKKGASGNTGSTNKTGTTASTGGITPTK